MFRAGSSCYVFQAGEISWCPTSETTKLFFNFFDCVKSKTIVRMISQCLGPDDCLTDLFFLFLLEF